MTNQNDAVMEFLLNRRSRPAKTLTLPVPDNNMLRPIITAAARTPDHGKLEPWRFIVLRKPQLTALADLVVKIGTELAYESEYIQKGAGQFSQGQLAVAVIEVQKQSPKIPPIEQTYSAGAVCLALLNASLAAGWGANWLTGWPAHNRDFLKHGLTLSENERLVGFIHIGTQTNTPPERPRPDIESIVTWA